MAIMNYPNTGYYNPPVTTQVIWVENEQEARGAYVAPGSTGFFMERQNPNCCGPNWYAACGCGGAN